MCAVLRPRAGSPAPIAISVSGPVGRLTADRVEGIGRLCRRPPPSWPRRCARRPPPDRAPSSGSRRGQPPSRWARRERVRRCRVSGSPSCLRRSTAALAPEPCACANCIYPRSWIAAGPTTAPSAPHCEPVAGQLDAHQRHLDDPLSGRRDTRSRTRPAAQLDRSSRHVRLARLGVDSRADRGVFGESRPPRARCGRSTASRCRDPGGQRPLRDARGLGRLGDQSVRSESNSR